MLPLLIAQTPKWLIVSKPPGWLTIPAQASDAAPVLRTWLEKEIGEKVFVVHRIDRETSGLVLFARHADSHREASGWFENRKVKKSYDFLAMGRPASPILKLNAPIEGSASITQVEVKERYSSCFFGRARPLSGRRHQIRIHLSGAGHPLLGDTRYQGPKQVGDLTIERTALHAAALELPDGNQFEAPWPEDFSRWVEVLRTK